VLKLVARDEAHPVLRWLMTDARRQVDANEFLEAFADELRAAGVDVSRITTGVPILHPQIFSFSGLWQLGISAQSLGAFPLKGVGAEQEIFAPIAVG
jgi:hypothetical protein